LNGANASRLQTRGKTQIELRRVNAHERVRALGLKPMHEITSKSKQPREMMQDFREPHDRQLVRRSPNLASESLHLRASDAEETRIRNARSNRRNQRRAECVAGRFACDQPDA
jgi:hypothetical protein